MLNLRSSWARCPTYLYDKSIRAYTCAPRLRLGPRAPRVGSTRGCLVEIVGWLAEKRNSRCVEMEEMTVDGEKMLSRDIILLIEFKTSFESCQGRFESFFQKLREFPRAFRRGVVNLSQLRVTCRERLTNLPTCRATF